MHLPTKTSERVTAEAQQRNLAANNSFTIQNSPDPEVSVVMPCLNEEDTLGICLRKACQALQTHGVAGEIIVADNGSTDRSLQIATEGGARIVHAARRGYGNALMAGISAARGKYIIMGDADDSYDFGEIMRFVILLRQGYDLVQGCRLPSGGGRVLPGAMPLSHRWLGNPAFTMLVRRMFGAPIHDVYCGLRGFNKQAYSRLRLRCTGMEFATEMVIKFSLLKFKVHEVPVTLHPDGRRQHAPHLKTIRDGWRTLRFFFLCSPRWLFLVPGVAAMALGFLGYAIAVPGLTIYRLTFDAHTLLVASLAVLVGQQSIFFSIFAKVFSCREGLLPPDARIEGFFTIFTLEKGIVGSLVAVVAGTVLLMWAVNMWRMADFGPLDYARTMRYVIPGVTLVALGVQTTLFSLMISIMSLTRDGTPE